MAQKTVQDIKLVVRAPEQSYPERGMGSASYRWRRALCFSASGHNQNCSGMPNNKNDNYNHTELIWDGKFEEQIKLPQKRAVDKIVLPFQTIELINEPREGTGSSQLFSGHKKEGWRNKLIWGDNKLVMSSLLREYAGQINLIYIDPPFDVGADFSVRVKVGDEEITKEPSILEEKAYRDTWGKGTNSYLQMLYERLLLMRELLAENGSIYVHLDWHIGHYVKILMDEIFGKDNFINEIIWNKGFRGTESKRIYQHSHDTIFLYCKTEQYMWNQQGQPYKDESLSRYNKIDEQGKQYAEIKRVRTDGTIYYGKTYPKEEGKRINDVISHITTMASTNTERIGYDTQKPEALLEVLIKTSSNEDDLVADFFCGSGTTGAVAERLGRRWVMGDLGRFAIHTSRKRLMEVQRKLKEESKNYYPFEILNLGKYERQHWQTAVVNGGRHTTEGKKINEYLKFIGELYRAEIVGGFTHLHAKKDKSFVHIGAVDAPVTMSEIKEAVGECKKNQFTNLDILGWEWEMGLNEEAIKWAKGQGVKLRLLQIPREVMDKRAAESGDVKFFELDYVEVNVERKGQEVKVALKNFAIPSEEFIPNDLRGKIANWSDYIDYWSVDWDYENLKSGDGELIFQNDWQTFRTKKSPKLELETPLHKYSQKGKYQILVKVIDIFGNDTSKVIEVKI